MEVKKKQFLLGMFNTLNDMAIYNRFAISSVTSCAGLAPQNGFRHKTVSSSNLVHSVLYTCLPTKASFFILPRSKAVFFCGFLPLL